ncbi:uncharacterized protein BX664DRAFT_319921 [Halteromyces radiatus]|uniref:uncharacterized protein n=1 Tax=Halteromyces radiatus TaxID=101107 RepID=UPI00221FFC13|nr:uncharacterized protein BX664DRAFT_319921 [Halteromyces radiatus]KAI8098916.1 hypothetical protein BX664DRAFT_319921 [Halteromyces radiatus]
MQFSKVLRAGHQPMIRFVGSRQALWKETPPHHGPHPLTPANLEKHVPKPEPVTRSTANVSSSTGGSIEMSQLPSRYKRLPLTDIEMEAIDLGGANLIY